MNKLRLAILSVSILIGITSVNIFASGGLVTDIRLKNVICDNVTTGKSVTIKRLNGASSWDCAKAGLLIKKGDVIKETLTGTSDIGTPSTFSTLCSVDDWYSDMWAAVVNNPWNPVRTKVFEAIAIADILKPEVLWMFYSQGMAGLTKYKAEIANGVTSGEVLTSVVTGIVIDDTTGEIQLTLSLPQLTVGYEDMLAFMPTIRGLPFSDSNRDGFVEWNCSKTAKAHPSGNAGVGSNTTILDKYLPPDCRS